MGERERPIEIEVDWRANEEKVYRKLMEYFKEHMGGFKEGELNKIYDYLRGVWKPETNSAFVWTILIFLREEYPQFKEFMPKTNGKVEEYSDRALEELEKLLAHEEQDTLRDVLLKFSKRLTEKYLRDRKMPQSEGF
ncbi:MAG: hypothetical protein QW156_04200 [Candidatus Aenigmatarchaeota archaeon]